MHLALFFPLYVRWHYTVALKDLWRFSGNLSWFLYHWFSIPLLFNTLFAPWKRLREEEHSRSRLASFFGNLTINIIMRIVGCFLRATTIFAGVLSLVLGAGLAIVLSLFWILLPATLIILFLYIIGSLLLLL